MDPVFNDIQTFQRYFYVLRSETELSLPSLIPHFKTIHLLNKFNTVTAAETFCQTIYHATELTLTTFVFGKQDFSRSRTRLVK